MIIMLLPRKLWLVCVKIEPKSLVIDHFDGQYYQYRLIAVLVFYVFGLALAVSVNNHCFANVEVMVSIRFDMLF